MHSTHYCAHPYPILSIVLDERNQTGHLKVNGVARVDIFVPWKLQLARLVLPPRVRETRVLLESSPRNFRVGRQLAGGRRVAGSSAAPASCQVRPSAG